MKQSAIKIECPCIVCGVIVKANGVVQRNHTVLEHRFSPGELAFVCDECRVYRAGEVIELTNSSGNWDRMKKVWAQAPDIE